MNAMHIFNYMYTIVLKYVNTCVQKYVYTGEQQCKL